jgi:ribonuclease-3
MSAARKHTPPGKPIDECLDDAERITGHRFADRSLLRSALTHPSAVEGKDPGTYYERLEFLGDSIVGLFVAEEAFRRFPSMPEGGLTRIKVSVVAGSVLAKVANELGIADVLIVGDSERGTGGRGRASALENAFEALTAALYLDAGPEAARAWVLRTLGPLISEESADAPESPKSRLQELAQAGGEVPVYRIASQDGPPHNRTFRAVVTIGGEVLGEGVGRSKKEAEAEAAEAALKSFSETP